MTLKKLLAAAAMLLTLQAVHADDLPPDQLVKSVTEEVLQIVRTDKDIQAGNVKKVNALIETKVLPNFDFTRMTQLAMGREWRNASSAQQQSLTNEFRTLLVRTYSTSLTQYRNQTIDYKPFTAKPDDTDVTVKTLVNQQGGGKPIPLDYSLEKVASGWKVYDIQVAGISLVTNYRDSFASEVRNSGIDGLIKALQAKNAAAK
ncbi:MAG TPA: ABC transporter substrate-binding protein [Rhodocyclaceae bacterium]|jgi:phospholipid transport system substrate-binding protein|nr:ABC transporter substrate-binding protein [Rhodocyclaceae bacterium]